MRSNTIPDFRDITVDFVTIYLWALYCPDSRSWLAQANSLILPEACLDSEMSENEVVGKSWTWTSLRARRHRVLPNLDREWYHVMASSALKHHREQVLQ